MTRIIQNFKDRILAKAYAHSKQHSRANLYEHLTRAIKEHAVAASAEVLNIGSGGEVANLLKSHDVAAVSFDIDEDRGPDVLGSVEDMNMFEDGKFDVVLLMEVLEHVQNPFLAAQEIRRVLKPGGVLIGSTPFILGIHDAPHDYYRFTKYGLAHIFTDMDTVEITPRNSTFDAANVLPLRLYAIGTPEEKNKLAFRWPMVRFANWLLQLAGRGISNSEATTGYFFTFRRNETTN